MNDEQKGHILELWTKTNDTYRNIANIINSNYGINYWDSERIRNVIRKYKKNNINNINNINTINVQNKTRILHISDSHCPFNLPKEVFKDYVNKIDVLVFGGDIQDCQGISKFRKKYRIPFVEEMINARQYMIDVIEYLKPKTVLVNYGNHDQRLISYFSDKIHEDLLQLMPETGLDFICDLGFWQHNHKEGTKTFYEPLVKVFNGIDFRYSRNWWCKVGRTIFAHPKAFKNSILGTSEKAYLYFLQLGEQFQSLCLSHTHKQAFSRYGKYYLYESGALCEEPEYANTGNMSKPQNQGFVYLVQDFEGNLIFNECKIICL